MYRKLYRLASRCAKLQTKNLEKAEEYGKKIDLEVDRLKDRGASFRLVCNRESFELPLKLEELPYFRPLFKMKTHRKLPEVGADDRQAVDFDVPFGTNIYSVEAGVITAIQSTATVGGNSESYQGMDNYIYIYNSARNLIFCYRHLARFDHLKEGDYIVKGQYLGKTGKTGYILTPHLHFAVYHYSPLTLYPLQSLPIKFES